MPENEDTTLAVLRSLDPVAGDVPPAPGSDRYEEIRRRVMAEVAPRTAGTPAAGAPTRAASRPARRMRVVAWTTAATTAVAASVLAVVAFGGTGPAAGDVMLVAADTTAAVTSFRGVSDITGEDGVRSASTIEVSGRDLRIENRRGQETVSLIVVGGTAYEKTEADPAYRSSPLDPESSLAPFGESAAAVVRAGLRDTDVETVGTEKVRDAETTHYRLSVSGPARDALAALPAGQTAWFELENPDEVASIDVWVAGDLIHRIAVDQGARDATVEFFDFGKPVAITAPPGA